MFNVLKKDFMPTGKTRRLNSITQQTLFMDFYAVHNTTDTCDQCDLDETYDI